MEIQQHDGVVVDAAGCRQGFAELIREREVLQGRREAPKAEILLPSLPPLYRPPWEGGRRPNPSRVGGAPPGLGGTPPLGRRPPRRSHLLGPAHPPRGPI